MPATPGPVPAHPGIRPGAGDGPGEQGGTGGLGLGKQVDWAVGSRRSGARKARGFGLGEEVDWGKGSRKTEVL